MNDSILKAQITIQQMKLLIAALDDLGQRLPNNPKLYAFMAEAPIDDLTRMLRELDEYLEQLKHMSAVSAPSVSHLGTTIPSPAAPGPIESAS